jgi:predicted ATP-binding protein involved in virulence
MQLSGFQVQMFKCFLNSGPVNVEALTVVVAKNEAGKTALLEALHKFNPFTPEPYSLQKEWPRAHRDKRSEEHVVCIAEFALSHQEREELAALTDQRITGLDRIRLSKDYAGNFEVHVPGEVFPDRLQGECYF